MPLYFFQWTDEVADHIEEHGISREDFEFVVQNPDFETVSRSSGLPASIGYTEDGRLMFAVYEFIDEITVLPVTAYEIDE